MVTESEVVNVADYVNPFDPDGWPFVRYQFRDCGWEPAVASFTWMASRWLRDSGFCRRRSAGRRELVYKGASGTQTEGWQARVADGIGVQAFQWSAPFRHMATTQGNEMLRRYCLKSKLTWSIV